MPATGRGPFHIAASDEYLNRLIKLIPAEVVALYLTFKEIASAWLGIWGWICLALVILVRSLTTRSTVKPAQWFGVFVASVSYVLWIYATGGYLVDVNVPAGVISVAIGVWTFIVPMFYKGEEVTGTESEPASSSPLLTRPRP